MPGRTALLLSALTATLSCPAVGQTKFTVTAEQEVYHAEENTNITMMWLLHFDTTRPPDVLMIDLIKLKTDTRIFFYDSHSDTETYPDESYRGRLQCDPQLTRRGRLECALTDLRLSDTGTYLSIVLLNGERSYKPCDLNVTAAIKDPAGETSKPASRGRIGLFAGLSVSAVLITTLSLCYFIWKYSPRALNSAHTNTLIH